LYDKIDKKNSKGKKSKSVMKARKGMAGDLNNDYKNNLLSIN
jgi:hypothetical protein